jgi:DNA-binding CsgD family transcriptional regulator
VNRTAQTAWEIIRSRSTAESIYHRIGEAITEVIPSDVSAIEVFDRNGDYAGRPWSNADLQISRHFDRFLANRFNHPLFKEFVISGLRDPTRISDCVEDRDFHATGMFNEFFRPMGMSTQMAVALPADSIGVPTLAIARSKSNYNREEKDVLRELIPQIRQKIIAERTSGHYELLMNQLIGSTAAVALVAFHAYVVHSTPQVSDVLDRYFPEALHTPHRLPQQLVILLRTRSSVSHSRHTFWSEAWQSSLTVTVCDSENGDQQILLFKQTESPHRKLTDHFALSPRLVDALILIEQGCSNKEIAARLRLSPNTVRTMVEKLLQRMNVSNRTQLASLARKCLDNA